MQIKGRPRNSEQKHIDRAVRIAQVFADGGGYEQVADAMGVTVHTAREYVRRAYEFTGTEGMAHLVAWGFRKGYLDIMFRCKECQIEFNNQGDARKHVAEVHSDFCDRKLEEYIDKSQRDAYEDLIEDVETKEKSA